MTALLAILLIAGQAPANGQSGPAPVVRAIEIRRIGVFDSTEASNWVFRLANMLHSETRESVIRSEILFQPGTPYDSAKVAESSRNLRALGLFRDVAIDTIRTDSGLVARVTVRDAWTTSFGVDVRRTGDQGSFSAMLEEANLLGTGSHIFANSSRFPDHDEVSVKFARPRLIGNQIGIDVSHQERTNGHQSILVLDRPFHSVASPYGFSVSAREFDGQVLEYYGGASRARDSLQNQTMQLVVQAAKAVRGDSRGYVRVGVIAQAYRTDYAPVSAPGLSSPIMITAGPTLAISHTHFETMTNYEHLQQPEDVDLSTTLSLGGLVVTSALGGPHNGFAPFATLRTGARLPGGFAIVEGMSGGLFSSSGLDSGTAVLGGTGVFGVGDPRQRVVVHLEGGMSRNAAPLDRFDLGFGIGPRGFDAHAFTGDRYFFTTAEYRFTVAPEFAHLVGIAVAAFADHGGAWFAGSGPRSGTDVGVGLRLGPTRQADLRTVRIDLIHRFANDVVNSGWLIGIGQGFTFSLAQ